MDNSGRSTGSQNSSSIAGTTANTNANSNAMNRPSNRYASNANTAQTSASAGSQHASSTGVTTAAALASQKQRLLQLQQMQFKNQRPNSAPVRRTSGTPLPVSPALPNSSFLGVSSLNATSSLNSTAHSGKPLLGPPSALSASANARPKKSSTTTKPPPVASMPSSTTSSSTVTGNLPNASLLDSQNSTTKAKDSTASHPKSDESSAAEKARTLALLDQCDWKDKTLWISRHFLGGQAVNGFLRSTASVQRIKKQRARQIGHSKKNKDDASEASGAKKEEPHATANAATNASSNTNANTTANATKKRDATEQESEEDLKKAIMNVRTAKKLKSELEMGVDFCVMLHEAIQQVVRDLNVGMQVPSLNDTRVDLSTTAYQLNPSSTVAPLFASSSTTAAAVASTTSAASVTKAAPATPTHTPGQKRLGAPPASLKEPESPSEPSTASAGNASGSTLRKSRKKKLPPSTEPPIGLPEFDANGKRIYSKKEYLMKLCEATRFRALKVGDFVAARVTSRDLWILAKVTQEYPGAPIGPVELLALSEAKREQLFKDKVVIKDVEDKSDGGVAIVARHLALPLPRSFSEAAEWCHRYKKGSRVYAMYPHTTSLYTATVVDSTTYCREDDDIVVVEFDGDEPDATGAIPKCHIPARFVTMIPSEFPGVKVDTSKSKSKKAGATSKAPSIPLLPDTKATMAAANSSEDFLDTLSELKFEDEMAGFDGFEDLDFDLGLED
jgi:hypothetical protein